MLYGIELVHKLCGTKFFGGGGPELPADPAPPPTETTADVQQEAETTRKKAKKQSGLQSTVLSDEVNPAGGATVLG